MKKNKSFGLGVALIIAATAYSFSLMYFVCRKVCGFIVRRFSFLLSCCLTGCALGMLYGSLVTESPVTGTWVAASTLIFIMAVGINCITWKED